MGGKVVVKAQVKIGGRGKAGGVKLAENAADAKKKAKQFWEWTLRVTLFIK